MRPFHVAIHTCPPVVQYGPNLTVQGRAVVTLAPAADLQSMPLAVGFEQACRALAAFPRMVAEADGSFLWSGGSPPQTWRLEGVLYDRGERLAYVELKGTCDRASFDQLLGVLRGSQERLMFQLLEQAVFLDEAAFRRLVFET